MENIEDSLENIYKQKSQGLHSEDFEQHMMLLEEECNKILLDEEERWKQKSRAIWIKSGDKNTQCFYLFASYRRNKKHNGR